MAKLKEQMTGRTSISYKTLYQETKRKLEILEAKTGVSVDKIAPVPTQREPIVLNDNSHNDDTQPNEAEETSSGEGSSKTSSKSNGEEPISIPEKGAEAVLSVAPNPSKDLELVEAEPEEVKPKLNPNDFEFRCDACQELFMEEGNKVEGGIKCPDCGKVYSNG